MNIVILGAGALGQLFGAKLIAAGHEVTLVGRRVELVDQIRDRGLSIIEVDGTRSAVPARATVGVESLDGVDAVLVLTKAHQVAGALVPIVGLSGKSSAEIVVLANGLGLDRLATSLIAPEKVLFGATATGAVKEADGAVRYTFVGETYFGPADGRATAKRESLGSALTDAGLVASFTLDVATRIWTKLLVNVAFNALTAVTGVTNGAAAAHPDGRAVMRALIKETMAVAQSAGIPLSVADPLGWVLDEVGAGIAPYRSSMLQDVDRGQQTEVDFLNGAVVRLGRELMVPTPVNETLWRLVKLVEVGIGVGGPDHSTERPTSD